MECRQSIDHRAVPGPNLCAAFHRHRHLCARLCLDPPQLRHDVPLRYPPASLPDVAVHHHSLPLAFCQSVVVVFSVRCLRREHLGCQFCICVGGGPALLGIETVQSGADIQLHQMITPPHRIKDQLEEGVPLRCRESLVDLFAYSDKPLVFLQNPLRFPVMQHTVGIGLDVFRFAPAVILDVFPDNFPDPGGEFRAEFPLGPLPGELRQVFPVPLVHIVG